MAYARGRRAVAHCNRCGFKIRYARLKQEWTGLWVCPECWDAKHPALTPPHLAPEAIALHHPQPDRDDDGTVETQLSDVIPMTFGDTE